MLQIETGRQRDPKESWMEESHRSFYTYGGFYTEKSLHKGAFYTQKVLHREVFTLRSFCTQTSRSLYTQKLLHKEVFTQIYSFHTQTRLHTEAFTQRNLYTLHREFLHTEAFTHSEIFTQTFHTEKLSHTEAFTQRSLYTKWFLHTETFTHKSFYTEKSLHRGAFTRSNKLKLAAVLREKTLAGAFGNSLAPQKKPSISNKVPIPWTFFKKHKEYISEAGPHPKAFKPTLRWNGGSRNPAEPTRGVSP